MPTALLPSLLLQILIVGYTPGPANIYALAMSLKYGRKQSLIMWLGLLTGFTTAVIGVATLTHFIGMAFSEHIIYLKYIGAAYILYLAYKIYTSHKKTETTNKDCNFMTGYIVQMTNAKMLLFDLTVFSTFVLPYSNRYEDLIIVCAWLLIAGPGANLVWLLTGTFLRKFFSNYQWQIDIVSAITLALCAVYIVLA